MATKWIYETPAVADMGSVISRTLGTGNTVSLEPGTGFRKNAESVGDSQEALSVTDSSRSTE